MKSSLSSTIPTSRSWRGDQSQTNIVPYWLKPETHEDADSRFEPHTETAHPGLISYQSRDAEAMLLAVLAASSVCAIVEAFAL